MEAKKSSESLTVKTAQILPPDTNAYGTLFGGKLMSHIDDVAAIAAIRHARRTCVTASTDSVDFLSPIQLGDFVILEAFVTYTHKTSMEVFVKIVTEEVMTGKRRVAATSFLTFVALDEDGRPTEVPQVLPESEQEKELHADGEARRLHRTMRRDQSLKMAKAFGKETLKNKGK